MKRSSLTNAKTSNIFAKLIVSLCLVFLSSTAFANTFTDYQNNPILSASESRFSLLTNPEVLKTPSGYSLYYGGVNGNNSNISLAVSSDGVDWDFHNNEIVFKCGENQLDSCTDNFNWSSKRVAAEAVIFDAGIYKMWYLGTNKNVNGVNKLGYATSSDGLNWNAYGQNPVFEPTIEGEELRYWGVVNHDGKFKLYVEDQLVSSDKVRVLVSDDGVNWSNETETNLPGKFFAFYQDEGKVYALDDSSLYVSNDGTTFDLISNEDLLLPLGIQSFLFTDSEIRVYQSRRPVGFYLTSALLSDFGIENPVINEREGLYTQIESPYPSDVETAEWADDEFAWGGDYWCGSTIAGCGCAITSLVMLGRDNGIENGVDGEDLNPASLNNWLIENGGYNSVGALIWSKALDYFGVEEDGLISTPLKMKVFDEPNRNNIEDYIEGTDTSVIGFDETWGHFFYLTDVLENGLGIFDPLWYDTLTTTEVRDIPNNKMGYDDVVDRGVVIELVEAGPQTGVIEATVESPTELVLVNSDGERSGYTEGGVADEIDNSWYVQDEIISSNGEDVSDREGTNHLLAVNQSGLYQLYVIGTETGEYILSLLLKDIAGSENYFEYSGETTPGQVEAFTIDLETGEIVLTPVDRTLFLLATGRATAQDTDQIRRFFEQWGNKIFDELDEGKVHQAVKHLSTFGKLQTAKKVVDSWLDELRSRLQEELEVTDS